MKNRAKIFTVINYILSSILWILGILTLLFNILGLWSPWQLAGFGFILYLPVQIASMILSVIFSHIENNSKMIVLNFVSFAISAGFIILTIFVSSTWFRW
ncbi:MAG: hypothetical protein E7635_01405 [Ruminococcaceae bacterium]|nr:hypothetical protein [Oscillospiraceae bacterium]